MLRTMFPRPYCIHSEGALDKSIYLLQPGEPLEEGVTDKEIISEAVSTLLGLHSGLSLRLRGREFFPGFFEHNLLSYFHRKQK